MTPRCERCPSGTTGGRLHCEFVLSVKLAHQSPWAGLTRLQSHLLLLSEEHSPEEEVVIFQKVAVTLVGDVHEFCREDIF